MFLDYLSEETKKRLYFALSVKCGRFEQTDSAIKSVFLKYCSDRNLPASEQSMFKLMGDESIIINDKTFCQVLILINGSYVPEYDGIQENKVFGLEAIKQSLEKLRNKELTIIVLEKKNAK